MRGQSGSSAIGRILGSASTSPHVELYKHASSGARERVDAQAFLQFLDGQGCVLAAKVFRARFEHSARTSRAAFEHELATVDLVRQRVGRENFHAYTTYRFYEDACAFSLRPKPGAPLTLTLKHKPDYKAYAVDEIFFMLHEACACSLDDVVGPGGAGRPGPAGAPPAPPAAACGGGAGGQPAHDMQEMDACVSKILQVLHGAGVAHRDIKPQNIVFCPFSLVRYKLVDYAFAADVHAAEKSASGGGCSSRQQPLAVAGTRAYISPYLLAYTGALSGGGSGSSSFASSLAAMRSSLPTSRGRRHFAVLLRAHLLSLRRSRRLSSPSYILLKSDEYAYMLTLLQLYMRAGDPTLLARATSLSLVTNCMFASCSAGACGRE
jgi:Protein kinase domain